jgi:hypothetical protein
LSFGLGLPFVFWRKEHSEILVGKRKGCYCRLDTGYGRLRFSAEWGFV